MCAKIKSKFFDVSCSLENALGWKMCAMKMWGHMSCSKCWCELASRTKHMAIDPFCPKKPILRVDMIERNTKTCKTSQKCKFQTMIWSQQQDWNTKNSTWSIPQTQHLRKELTFALEIRIDQISVSSKLPFDCLFCEFTKFRSSCWDPLSMSTNEWICFANFIELAFIWHIIFVWCVIVDSLRSCQSWSPKPSFLNIVGFCEVLSTETTQISPQLWNINNLCQHLFEFVQCMSCGIQCAKLPWHFWHRSPLWIVLVIESSCMETTT